MRWPGKVPAGKVSNELVHEVDFFTTLVNAGGGTVPADRQIDGMDMTDFLLGDAEESGRDIVLCLQGNRLQAAKWRQWKVHLFKQDDFYSTWVAVQHADCSTTSSGTRARSTRSTSRTAGWCTRSPPRPARS